MRAALLGSLVLLGLALTAAPAVPKEGVYAVAEDPVRLTAPPGTKLRVTWRLRDREGSPFGAGGIYLRVSRCGRRPKLVPATELGLGRYTARFTVPKGGIRKLMVGLEGWRTAAGRTERADARFSFRPSLVRRCG